MKKPKWIGEHHPTKQKQKRINLANDVLEGIWRSEGWLSKQIVEDIYVRTNRCLSKYNCEGSWSAKASGYLEMSHGQFDINPQNNDWYYHKLIVDLHCKLQCYSHQTIDCDVISAFKRNLQW